MLSTIWGVIEQCFRTLWGIIRLMPDMCQWALAIIVVVAVIYLIIGR